MSDLGTAILHSWRYFIPALVIIMCESCPGDVESVCACIDENSLSTRNCTSRNLPSFGRMLMLSNIYGTERPLESSTLMFLWKQIMASMIFLQYNQIFRNSRTDMLIKMTLCRDSVNMATHVVAVTALQNCCWRVLHYCFTGRFSIVLLSAILPVHPMANQSAHHFATDTKTNQCFKFTICTGN